MLRVLLAVLGLVLLSAAAQALESARSGVVLVHGKWGNAASLRILEGELEDAGFLVEAPDMAWSGSRLFDKTLPDAVAEIDAAISRLVKKGRSDVVLVGHSLGGLAILAHAARGEQAFPLVLIAPAHFPEGTVFLPKAAPSVAKARAMVEAGEGEDTASFLSLNSDDRSRFIRTSAAIYLSYYAPDGPGAMSLFAPKVALVPTLWIAPTKDGATAGFDRLVASKLPDGMPIVRADVVSDHMNAPTDGRRKIVEWLLALPR